MGLWWQRPFSRSKGVKKGRKLMLAGVEQSLLGLTLHWSNQGNVVFDIFIGMKNALIF